jgi:hypothetical protein
MAKAPEDMILPMLREMRGEMRERFSNVDEQLGEIRARLDKLESGQKTIRQALTADTMMSKFVTGDFEERIFELERKVEGLLKGK